MVKTRTGRGGEVKQVENTEGKKTRKRNENVELKKENEKTPIKKSESAIHKRESPTKKSPIKKLIFTASPGRTSYKLRRAHKEDMPDEMEMEKITRRLNVLEMSPSLSQDSAISIGDSLSTSSLSSERDELNTPPPSDSMDTTPSTLASPIVPLQERECQFNTLISLIDGSVDKKEPLTIYISGTPGAGKSATIERVLKLLQIAPRNIKTCTVNCMSVQRGDELCAAIMQRIDKPCATRSALSKFKEFVSALRKPFLLVLDETDKVNKDALATFLTMPAAISAHLIVVGIANTIDLVDRDLKKMTLKLEPERIVFPGYTKEELVRLMTTKQREENWETIDASAIEFCARQVASRGGDIREAMSTMREGCRRLKLENEKKAMTNENLPSTPVVAALPLSVRSIRAIKDTRTNVLASPLTRVKLQQQPKVLLALCFKLQADKKKQLTRDCLLNEYRRASGKGAWQMVEGSDLKEALDMLVAQSFISTHKDLIRLQVDARTARTAISDDDLLQSIDFTL
ncbi:hypothetical protein PENTCL1PPCAC_22412 [Pristionchus entomophagus]|uniref:ORC1/DEAH AAA+ ATPase domain-containing protein n=1 Tax=Pristionchus entomophagus TaxID=358040 RepID=A0AAV5U191_9BILA|nr:hypothetical protein PENTCL1PPCAC_22412 [Pristionchus entomophagus]